MSGELQLTLLGEPQVSQGGVPVTGFISAKTQALLYYLAVTGQPHTRETLAGLLWGEMPEARARKNLTKALSNLRKLVGPYLIIDRHTAAFNQDIPSRLDVQLFLNALESKRPEEELEPLRQAVELYRGDFLAGFYVKEAPAFEEWVLSQQERLQALLLQALQTLSGKLTAREEYAVAIDYTTRLLALDPYREAAHRQMMLLLARSGQRSAALAQYETCRRILAKELDTEPMAETMALYDRLKAAAVSPPHNLPLQPTAFVGREAELAKITALLDDPTCRLLTIAGPGGIGKSRLALQAAARYVQPETAFGAGPGFPDGVYLVSLAPLDSVEAIVPTLAEALNFSFYKKGEPQQQLLDYLRQKTALLIMDSFEHLLPPPLSPTQKEGRPGGGISPKKRGEKRGVSLLGGKRGGTELVTAVLETAPGIKILTTSRSRLNVQGEHLLPLAGMDFPKGEGETPEDSVLRPSGVSKKAVPRPVETRPAAGVAGALPRDIADYSAVHLFLQSARRVQPDFELTPGNIEDVARICRLVEGMPLGILLAAAWVEMLTPAEIVAEIGQSLDFLETEWRDMPARQRSIRAAFDHSWGLLTRREQEVLAQLSIFRGDFTRQAVQAVTEASLRELMALVNKSLLYRAPLGRYAVHELLRQYAVEKLDQAPDAGAVARDRHSAYYALAWQRLGADLTGPRQQTALAGLEADSENARAAWNWAVEQGQITRLAQMIDSLGQFYVWRGRYQEGEAACRTAANKLGGAASGDRLRILARLRAWQGIFNQQLGLTGLAGQLLEESLTLLDSPTLVDLDVRPEKAFVLLQMGEVARESDRQKARKLYEQSLTMYQASGDEWGTANVLASLGWLIQHLGAYTEAKELYADSLAVRQALEDQRGIASSLKSLGGIALYQGQHEEAERLIRQSIAIHQEMGNRAGIAGSLSKLGETLTLLGRFIEARSPLEESQAIYNDLGLRDAGAFSEAMVGQATMHLGHYEQARTQGQTALTLFREIGSRRGIGYALLVLGWAALVAPGYRGQATLAGEGQAEAQQLLQESLSIYREIGQRDELGQALALLGYTAYRLGDMPQAQRHLSEALQTAAEIRAFMPLMLALPAIALILAEQGEQERAVELYALAWCYPLAANSRWFEDVAGQHLAAVAAALPPEVVAAARQRGQARALESVVGEMLNKLY